MTSPQSPPTAPERVAPPPPPPPPPPAPPAPSLLSALSGRGVAVALVLGLAAGLLLSPVFATPLPVVLGRTLFLAMTLLLVYVLASAWPQRWLPGWMPRGAVQLLAVALAVPVASLAAAMFFSPTGGWSDFLDNPGRVLGYLLIAGVGLLLGLVVTPMALLRERDAQARTQVAQFELERSRLEKQAVDARLALLQAQIEPHFLFNTLANVQALVESGSPRAPAVLSHLIAYLRAALPRLHAGAPTLGTELELVRAYLALMQMRMPDRLAYRVEVDPALAARAFPAMALLTLVENAVRHGLDPAEDGGEIEVGGRAEANGGCCLWVADTGVGLADHAPPGVGLNNLRARLQGFFGPGAELQLHEVSPHGLRVELHLPAAAGEAAAGQRGGA